jgi:transposase
LLTGKFFPSLDAGFDALYAGHGRPSIAPEYILRAFLPLVGQ